MDRRAVIVVLAGTIVAVLFAAIAAGGEVQYAERSPTFWNESSNVIAPAPTIAPPTTVDPDERDPSGRGRFELPHIVEIILQFVFWGAVAVVAVAIVVSAWRNRPRVRWRRRRLDTADFDPLEDIPGAIVADAQAQRAALRRGSPRNGIVECWLRLEAAVIDAGVQRMPSDTSAELTERVLTVHRVEPAAIAELAALYREARFSDHAMGEDARRAAIEALDAVHDSLRSDTHAVVST